MCLNSIDKSIVIFIENLFLFFRHFLLKIEFFLQFNTITNTNQKVFFEMYAVYTTNSNLHLKCYIFPINIVYVVQYTEVKTTGPNFALL